MPRQPAIPGHAAIVRAVPRGPGCAQPGTRARSSDGTVPALPCAPTPTPVARPAPTCRRRSPLVPAPGSIQGSRPRSSRPKTQSHPRPPVASAPSGSHHALKLNSGPVPRRSPARAESALSREGEPYANRPPGRLSRQHAAHLSLANRLRRRPRHRLRPRQGHLRRRDSVVRGHPLPRPALRARVGRLRLPPRQRDLRPARRRPRVRHRRRPGRPPGPLQGQRLRQGGHRSPLVDPRMQAHRVPRCTPSWAAPTPT